MRRSGILCFAAVTALLTLPLPAIAEEALRGDEIPPRPEQLRFHESSFRVPDGNAYRHTLKGGVVVYVVEDHTMPLVDVSVILRVGGFLDPPGNPGLIELTAAMLPRGGAGERSAEEVADEVDLLADEGLVYGIRSRVDLDPFQPGAFVILFQTKSPTVALATRIALEEVRRIRREPVAADELVLAKRSLIDRLPRGFETPQRIARRFAEDAYLGRPHAAWQSRRERIEGVTAEDVQRVAAGYLDPEAMLLLVVGGWDEIAPGDADRRASMKDFFEGRVEHLPWRDPLTLEAVSTNKPESQ